MGCTPSTVKPNSLADRALLLEAAPQMIHPEKVVTINPYFKVKPGKMSEAKDLLRQMVARTSTESANLYYDFTVNGDVVFCREAYVGMRFERLSGLSGNSRPKGQGLLSSRKLMLALKQEPAIDINIEPWTV